MFLCRRLADFQKFLPQNLIQPLFRGAKLACGHKKFDYHLTEAGKAGGSTTIQLVDGSCIVYQINEKLLVDAMTWKNPAGRICKEERFIWNAQQRCERKKLYADNQLVSIHSYSYDAKGNPLTETVSGNLTGHLAEGVAKTTCIRRTYSQDALALLLSEERDNRRLDRYHYLPGTDLLQSHFVYNTFESKLIRLLESMMHKAM